MQLSGSPLQALTECWCRDRDERSRAFREVTAVQRGDSVFGDDVVHMRPGGCHRRTSVQHWHDPRNLAIHGREHAADTVKVTVARSTDR